MKTKEICGNCSYHRHIDDEWVCCSADSECYGCYTEYHDYCDCFESRYSEDKISAEVREKMRKNLF